MTPYINTAGGNRLELDLSDPFVRSHFEAVESYTDHLLQEINETKLYEPLFSGKKGLVFFDLGANIGLVSLYAHDVCRIVTAVEPVHYELLCKMVKGKAILPVREALHDKDEDVKLFLCAENTTAHSTAVKVGTTSITVPGRKLSTMLKPYLQWSSFERHGAKVDVVKVDVEGSEMTSLSESEIGSVSGSVRVFYIEVHPCQEKTVEENVAILSQRLKANGYRVEVQRGYQILARHE